jgi:hypothetical protein
VTGAPARPNLALPNLAAARLWAARGFPYLSSAIFGLKATPGPGTGIVTVDERWRLRADPQVTAGWTAAQFGSVLVHLACHLLQQHAKRAGALCLPPAEAGWWADAADADWRRLLAAELRRAVADVAGAVDYSYSRPARRAVEGVVLPACPGMRAF